MLSVTWIVFLAFMQLPSKTLQEETVCQKVIREKPKPGDYIHECDKKTGLFKSLECVPNDRCRCVYPVTGGLISLYHTSNDSCDRDPKNTVCQNIRALLKTKARENEANCDSNGEFKRMQKILWNKYGSDKTLLKEPYYITICANPNTGEFVRKPVSDNDPCMKDPPTSSTASTTKSTTIATTPKSTTIATTPKSTTIAKTTESTTLAPTTESTTVPPTTKSTTVDPTTEPTTKVPTTEPTTKVPTTEPTTIAPATESTTKASTTESTTETITTAPTTIALTTEVVTEMASTEATSTEIPKCLDVRQKLKEDQKWQGYWPVCDKNGSFTEIQCRLNNNPKLKPQCYCVTANGIILENVETISKEMIRKCKKSRNEKDWSSKIVSDYYDYDYDENYEDKSRYIYDYNYYDTSLPEGNGYGFWYNLILQYLFKQYRKK